jgi:hypothetical protein
MPLVRRRRPLLRAVAIACGAYSAGKGRRQGPQESRLDQVGPGPQPADAARGDAAPEWLRDLYRPDAFNGVLCRDLTRPGEGSLPMVRRRR